MYSVIAITKNVNFVKAENIEVERHGHAWCAKPEPFCNTMYSVFGRDAVEAKAVHELCEVLKWHVHVGDFLHDVLLQSGLALVGLQPCRW